MKFEDYHWDQNIYDSYRRNLGVCTWEWVMGLWGIGGLRKFLDFELLLNTQEKFIFELVTLIMFVDEILTYKLEQRIQK